MAPVTLDHSPQSATAQSGFARLWHGRTAYLSGAVCAAISAVMLAPIVFTIISSFKDRQEQLAVPPQYLVRDPSVESYAKLWNYQDGLLVYLFNSTATAFLAIVFCLGLTVPAGYALARLPVPRREVFFVFLLLALIIPYQALITPVFFMFAALKLSNTLVGLAIVHTAIQIPFSVYIMRNAFDAVPPELEEAAILDGCSSWQVLVRVFIPAVVPAMITVALFAFIMSWNEFLAALVIMNRGDSYTLPLILAASREETTIGGTDWGMLQAGITISIVPCMAFYLALQRYYVAGFLNGAIK